MKKLLLLSIILIIYASGCVQTALVQGFTFNSEKGTCTSKENSDAEALLSGGKIIFSGSIVTSTPCYELKALYSASKIKPERGPETEMITITITKEPTGEVCVQCVGEISFNGEILINRELWNSGNYGIRIVYEGKELTSLYSYVT